jgi:hypothetical protein
MDDRRMLLSIWYQLVRWLLGRPWCWCAEI